MDISKYGVRVIRKTPKGINPSTKISSINPVDIEGTVLNVVMPSYAMLYAMKKGEWFDVFFTLTRDGCVKVRWDNDTRGVNTISSLSIRSFGTLPIYWPLNAPSKEELAHRFDFRPAEELCPRTLPDEDLNDIYKELEQVDLSKIGSSRKATTTGRTSVKLTSLMGTYNSYYGNIGDASTTTGSGTGSSGTVKASDYWWPSKYDTTMTKTDEDCANEVVSYINSVMDGPNGDN